MTYQTPLPGRRSARLNRTVSTVALATGMIGGALLATPAAAQCVQGPPNTYTCAGQTIVPQILVGDDISAATTAGFAVDTTANGNGLALQMTGDGQITYTDLQASTLTGAGVRFSSTGSSGLDAGSLVIFSDGAIVADGASGLWLDNGGAGDTTAVWSGSILNSGGIGVFMRNSLGSGDASLTVSEVHGRDDGVRIDFDGAGSLTFTAQGPLTGAIGSGLRIDGDDAGGDQNIQVGEVTGGRWGVLIDNRGAGSTRLVSTGTVTGLGEAGITVEGDASITGVEVIANQVNGQTYGVQITNAGTGTTSVITSGTVAAATATGIEVVNDVNTTGLSISATDVFGSAGIVARNFGTGAAQVFSTGQVNGFTTDGILVGSAASATDVLIDVNDVTGVETGIKVSNNGSGDTIVRSSGTVTGDIGFDIATGSGSQGVVVEAVDVAGSSSGIVVAHQGSAGVSVTATGVVSGGVGTGIHVDGEVGTTDISIQAASVSGGYVGIRAINDGLGSTFISATGPVSGGSQGILAEGGSFTTDMTIEVGDVTGDLAGIDVVNFGSGWTRVRSTGAVVGGAWDGISVETGTGSEGVVIEVLDVHGDQHGIALLNQGTGPSVVTATGEISTVFGSGIEVTNGFGTAEIEINVAAVSGGDRGISASSEGLGGVYVTATGPVSGADFGILAEIGAAGANVQVDAVDVFSDGVGILAENDGDGFTRVISTGTVVGTDEAGIRAFGGTNSFNITIDANNASGGFSGVSAVSFGLGPVEITTHGLVEGGGQGIEAFSAANGVSIVNEGTVRNASGLSTDRAINAVGDSVAVQNWGLVVGELSITGSASLFRNEGTWAAAGGTSDFLGGDDVVFNRLNGVIYAGSEAGVAETTTWTGLEAFINRGLLQMLDGGAGDVLQITGGASFEDTARFAVDIGGAGLSDVVRTGGAVDIEAGSVLTVSMAQPLVLNSQYVVVDAAGGLTGEFDFEDEMLTAFAGLRDGYTANSAYIEFVQLKALVEAGITPNQKAAAAGADSLPDGNPVKDALLLLPDDAAAIDAFDQLSGEIHPSARTAGAEDSRLPRDAVLARLTDGQPDGAVWGRVIGDRGSNSGDFNAAGADRDTHGLLMGVDRAIAERLIVGVAAGWTSTDVEIERRDSAATVESVHALAYLGGRFGQWGLRAGVGYAETSFETARLIAFPGFSATPEAGYDGSVLHGFVEAGYSMAAAGGHAEPFVNLTTLRSETGAFAETGGAAALSGEAIEEDVMMSTLGVRLETNWRGAFSMRGVAGWRHVWGDLEPTGVHAFTGGAPFTVLGAALSEEAAVANLEARWRLTPNVSLSVALDSVLGDDSSDHAITGGFKVVF